MDVITLRQTRIGTPQQIGTDREGRPKFSSIHRQLAPSSHIYLTWTGLAGDTPTDTQPKSNGGQIHGGNDKAVYVFPAEHYARWGVILGDALGRRSFGENFRTQGVTEGDVCIGDLWQIGDALLEVSKPRTPCDTLAIYFGRPSIKREMYQTGMCGWYLMVKQPGIIPTSGIIELVGRQPDNPLTIAQAFAAKRRAEI